MLGELIITPFTESSILEIKSSKSGSNCSFEIVFTNRGSAPAILINSGKETQYGEKTITLSPLSNKAWHTTDSDCLPPFETMIFSGL